MLVCIYKNRGLLIMKKEKKDSILHIRINSQLKNKLTLYCYINNISVSKFIILFLNDFLENYFEGMLYEDN